MYARRARRARVARRSPRALRPRSARSGDRREDVRRGRRPATGREKRRGPPRRAMSRLSCGGENHPRCTRAARAACASPAPPRAPRPRSSRSGDRREDARRGRRPATGRASRRARVWGVHVRDEEGGGFTICHRRTLRACPKLSSRRHEYKVEVRVHTSCGVGRGTRAECVCRLFFAIDEAES